MNDDEIIAALSTVMDPELRRSVVDLGMVRDILSTDETVSVRLMLTTAACPLKNRIKGETEQALAAIAGARRVEVIMDAMSPEECERLAASVKADPRTPRTPFGPGSSTRVIAVASGKGGVGKSTVTANLAVALAMRGRAVGLIDADVYGPTIPLMLGLAAVAPKSHDGKLVPPEAHGVKVVSMGLFLQDDEPVVWRGPMLGRAMEQFLGDVLWGSPDYLLIDLPPGTGDIALTVAQMLPAAEIIVVTTPQEAAAKVAAKAAKMARLTKHRVVGVVENMSYFVCPDCGAKHFIFGHGGAFEIARGANSTLLGRIPLDEATRSAGDAGEPPALDPAGVTGAVFHEIAGALDTLRSAAAGRA
jgi:ATP-binding protein involved in chromosome partitioning